MSSEYRPTDLQSPFRRQLLIGSAALSATALLPPFALAQQFPTAKVNTTGLAVTDAAVKRIDWAGLGTWLWLALMAWIAITGLIKLRGGIARASK